MRNISAWAIRHPVLPVVLFVVLTCIGIVSFIRLPINQNPDIDYPIVDIFISQPGAAPSEIETQILQKVEGAVADQERFAAQFTSRQADLEQAKTSLKSNEISVEAERRTKDVLESQERQLVADLHAKEAGLKVAQVNLGYTQIRSPGDGIVGERQVRPGQLLSPGAQILTFVADTRWVQANYRETQLTHIKVGDPAEIRVDLYPDRVWKGHVVELAPASGSQFALLPPDNATGNFTKVVQRVPVKIAFDDANRAAELRPGLSVVSEIRTKQ